MAWRALLHDTNDERRTVDENSKFYLNRMFTAFIVGPTSVLLSSFLNCTVFMALALKEASIDTFMTRAIDVLYYFEPLLLVLFLYFVLAGFKNDKILIVFGFLCGVYSIFAVFCFIYMFSEREANAFFTLDYFVCLLSYCTMFFMSASIIKTTLLGLKMDRLANDKKRYFWPDFMLYLFLIGIINMPVTALYRISFISVLNRSPLLYGLSLSRRTTILAFVCTLAALISLIVLFSGFASMFSSRRFAVCVAVHSALCIIISVRNIHIGIYNDRFLVLYSDVCFLLEAVMVFVASVLAARDRACKMESRFLWLFDKR